MSNNIYTFNTELVGFIKMDEDGVEYNNRTFGYIMPSEVMEQAEKDREELLKWAKSKVSGRVDVAMTPWDEQGQCKYSYGEGTNGKPKPAPVIVDSEGQPLGFETLRAIRKGTKVQVIVKQSPYTKPRIGTKLVVLGVMVIELSDGQGGYDSGDLSEEQVISMFKATSGFKQGEPEPRQAEKADAYDF